MQRENKDKDPVVLKAQDMQRRAWLSKRGVAVGEPIQLEILFPQILSRNDLRHLPNDFARSSLFTARNKRVKRAAYLRKKLFHYNEDVIIYYTGIELRAADDELVWLQILDYARRVSLGSVVEFNIKDLVADIGWPRNGRYYEKARECISRLKANEVLVQNEKTFGRSGAISLIGSYGVINDQNGVASRYYVSIDPNVIVLFAGNSFTSHSWETYRGLSPVARRIADYMGSHRVPFPLSVEKLHDICGSDDNDRHSWRRTVRRACVELEATPLVKKISLDDRGMICCIRN